jgi:ATP-binding cassette subfamily B protein
MMGLLDPTAGQILVDGQPVTGAHRRAWQRSIAHVPQSIFLSDATMAENIAFGVPPGKIDLARVQEAAKIAHIHDFIESQPKGYKPSVGERGVRLSGGQRQRIGIARALYKQASVLVFDEATSALDNTTERDLMNAIDTLSRDLTILMIAHRISTVVRCDKIAVMEQGKIVALDSYDRLLASNEIFRSLAAQAEPASSAGA